MIKLISLNGFTFFVLLVLGSINAQASKVDSLQSLLNEELTDVERISVLHKLAARLVNVAPDSALVYARQSFELSSGLDDVEVHARSYRRMGHCLYVNDLLPEFQSSLESYIEYAQQHKMYDQVAAGYRNLSKIGEATKAPDLSLQYLDKCLEVLNEHPDSVILVDVYLSKGLSYIYKGSYEQSIDALLQALRVAEAIGSKKKLGYIHQNIAITYAVMGDFDNSVRHSRLAIDRFEKVNNQRGVTRTLNNLGIALYDLDSLDAAIPIFERAISNSEKTKMPNIAMHSHYKLAQIYKVREQRSLVEKHIVEVDRIAREIDDQFNMGAVARFRSQLAIDNGQLDLARRYMWQAKEYLSSHREPIEEEEIYREMSDIYYGLRDYKEAYDYNVKARVIADSVYTQEKEKQFQELLLTYETEKKDAEIAMLNKQAELDATRKRALGGGLGLLFLLSGGIIYGQVQRRKRIQENAENEKQIEIEKRKSAEQELEFKKKELTSKALQLARKNEFLQQLESEVSELKSSVDSTINKTTDRISRMIQMDAADDEEWEQFGREFSSVHQDFLDRLKAKHGKFSKGEMRLIALLKMNLSSKDIANTLRISDEGIKKARYRLRKKLELDSDIDLAKYIISF